MNGIYKVLESKYKQYKYIEDNNKSIALVKTIAI